MNNDDMKNRQPGGRLTYVLQKLYLNFLVAIITSNKIFNTSITIIIIIIVTRAIVDSLFININIIINKINLLFKFK